MVYDLAQLYIINVSPVSVMMSVNSGSLVESLFETSTNVEFVFMRLQAASCETVIRNGPVEDSMHLFRGQNQKGLVKTLLT